MDYFNNAFLIDSSVHHSSIRNEDEIVPRFSFGLLSRPRKHLVPLPWQPEPKENSITKDNSNRFHLGPSMHMFIYLFLSFYQTVPKRLVARRRTAYRLQEVQRVMTSLVNYWTSWSRMPFVNMKTMKIYMKTKWKMCSLLLTCQINHHWSLGEMVWNELVTLNCSECVVNLQPAEK